MEKRYEIFVSSTYRDLIEERQIINDIIVAQDNFPTGMEGFVGGRPPWHHIERAIRSCDYYLLIVGGCYGSINPHSEPPGLSFTECEYRLALELKKEILPVILSDKYLQKLSPEKRDADQAGRDKFNVFREYLKAENTVTTWDNLKDLRVRIPAKIAEWIKENPVAGGGWIRLSELKQDVSQGQIFTYLFNRLNPHENVLPSWRNPYADESLTRRLIRHLDERLDSIADVINVLEWLIETYVEELIDAPIRVYFAYSLNRQHLAQDWWREKKTIEVPAYRLGISNSKNGAWRQGSVINGRSNIHNVYQRCEILSIPDSTKRGNGAGASSAGTGASNVPVGGEGSVIAAPVYALSSKTPVGVVGINSPLVGVAPEHRGLIRELSALFSSLFYAYCSQLKQDSESKLYTVKVKKPRSSASEQPARKSPRHDLLIYLLRNEIVEHFNFVLADDDWEPIK